MSTQLPQDIYGCIAERIADPLTYLNYLLSAKICHRAASPFRERKQQQFFHRDIIDISGLGWWFIERCTSLYLNPAVTGVTHYTIRDGIRHIIREGNIIDDKKEGEWREYADDKLTAIRNYRADNYHGVSLYYINDTESLYEYVNGVKHGPFVQRTATTEIRGRFENGGKVGWETKYLIDGPEECRGSIPLYRVFYIEGKETSHQLWSNVQWVDGPINLRYILE